MSKTMTVDAATLREQLATHEQELVNAEHALGAAELERNAKASSDATRRITEASTAIARVKAAMGELERRDREAETEAAAAARSQQRVAALKWMLDYYEAAEAALRAAEAARLAHLKIASFGRHPAAPGLEKDVPRPTRPQPDEYRPFGSRSGLTAAFFAERRVETEEMLAAEGAGAAASRRRANNA